MKHDILKRWLAIVLIVRRRYGVVGHTCCGPRGTTASCRDEYHERRRAVGADRHL